MHGNPDSCDVDCQKASAVLTGKDTFGFDGLPVPAIEPKYPVGFRNRVPALEIRQFTAKRLEAKPGPLSAHTSTLVALTRALEVAGVEFIDENGGGPGGRLRTSQRPKQPK